MRKGLLKILIANIISLAVNILNSFLLPKFLSVDTYAVLKTYTFYVGYAGFLSLGFVDGMYLKYGGKELNKIDKDELGTNLRSYVVLEVVICITLAIIALVMRDVVVFSVALGALFINIIGYYKNLYQAVGEYNLYGKSLNYQTILLFISNLILIFVIRTDNENAYVAVQVASALLISLYLSILIEKKLRILKRGRVKAVVIKENIFSGFTLMLGNFSSSLLTGLDRWFVKFLMDNVSFALYSFAVSLENIVNVFVTPITISLYNAFCKKNDVSYIRNMKCFSMIWGLIVVAAAFPVKFILEHYLTNYIEALEVIFPLFAAQIFYVIIKGIHVNLYKVEHKQKKYFLIMIILVVVATVLNGLFYYFYNSEKSFAIATLVTAILWFAYCEFENSKIRFKINEYLTLIIMLTVYFFSCHIESSTVGIIIYMCALLLTCSLLMKNTMKIILHMVKNMLVQIGRR